MYTATDSRPCSSRIAPSRGDLVHRPFRFDRRVYAVVAADEMTQSGVRGVDVGMVYPSGRRILQCGLLLSPRAAVAFSSTSTRIGRLAVQVRQRVFFVEIGKAGSCSGSYVRRGRAGSLGQLLFYGRRPFPPEIVLVIASLNSIGRSSRPSHQSKPSSRIATRRETDEAPLRFRLRDALVRPSRRLYATLSKRISSPGSMRVSITFPSSSCSVVEPSTDSLRSLHADGCRCARSVHGWIGSARIIRRRSARATTGHGCVATDVQLHDRARVTGTPCFPGERGDLVGQLVGEAGRCRSPGSRGNEPETQASISRPYSSTARGERMFASGTPPR